MKWIIKFSYRKTVRIYALRLGLSEASSNAKFYYSETKPNHRRDLTKQNTEVDGGHIDQTNCVKTNDGVHGVPQYSVTVRMESAMYGGRCTTRQISDGLPTANESKITNNRFTTNHFRFTQKFHKSCVRTERGFSLVYWIVSRAKVEWWERACLSVRKWNGFSISIGPGPL